MPRKLNHQGFSSFLPELFQNPRSFLISSRSQGIFGILIRCFLGFKNSYLFFLGGEKASSHDSVHDSPPCCRIGRLDLVGPYRAQLLRDLGSYHARLAYFVVDGESWQWCNVQCNDGQLPGGELNGCGNGARKWHEFRNFEVW